METSPDGNVNTLQHPAGTTPATSDPTLSAYDHHSPAFVSPWSQTTLAIDPAHGIRLSVVPSSTQVPDAVSTLSLRPVGSHAVHVARRLRSHRDPVRCPADPPRGVDTPAGRRIQPFQPTITIGRPL